MTNDVSNGISNSKVTPRLYFNGQIEDIFTTTIKGIFKFMIERYETVNDFYEVHF